MAAPRKKPPIKKAVSGTMGERLGEAKNRPYKGTKDGAVTKVTKPRATGRQYSGDTIRMKGQQQGVTKPKVVPLGDRPKLLSGPKSRAAAAAIGVGVRNAAVRAVGVGAIFDPSFMSYKTGGAAGEGSDKTPKYGRSLRAEAEARKKAAFGTGGGNPKTVNPYRSKEIKQANPGLSPNSNFIKQQIDKNKKAKASKAMIPKSSMAGGGVNKPDTAKDKMKRQLQGRKPDVTPSAPAQDASKAAAPAAVKKPAFKGNWTGAGATEMQKRGGAKIKRPNLLSLFRKKGK